MSIDDFMKLVPYLHDVDTAVLEGWGEPLLYKDLIKVIRLVKEAQCRAGVVTSGWGLDDEQIAELLGSGLDFIGFSLSGATPETHNVIRSNSNLLSLLGSIRTFQELKAQKKLLTPKLHIVFLMLRDNVTELSLLLDQAKAVGIDDIVLINLIQVSNEWQEAQRLFACHEGEENAIMMEAAIKARNLKIQLRTASLAPREVGVCDENPLRNLYISVDGNVSPCVYLHPPVPSPFRRIFCGAEQSVERVSFGNVFKKPFETIWSSAPYAEFRDCFAARQKRFGEKYPALISGPAGWSRGRHIELPLPPAPCRACHKALGL